MEWDILEFLCCCLGRTVWRALPFEFTRKRNLSDGSYELIGILLAALAAVFTFVVWVVASA